MSHLGHRTFLADDLYAMIAYSAKFGPVMGAVSESSSTPVALSSFAAHNPWVRTITDTLLPFMLWLVGWLVVFWFNASKIVCESISSRLTKNGRKKRKMTDERKKNPNSHRPHLLQTQQALVLLASNFQGSTDTVSYSASSPNPTTHCCGLYEHVQFCRFDEACVTADVQQHCYDIAYSRLGHIWFIKLESYTRTCVPMGVELTTTT